VVVKGVAAEDEEDQVPPTGVGGRLQLENHRDKQADVLDPPRPGSEAASREDQPGRAR
jgi:hypothetical protein